MIATGLLHAAFVLVIICFSKLTMNLCLLKEEIQETSFLHRARKFIYKPTILVKVYRDFFYTFAKVLRLWIN